MQKVSCSSNAALKFILRNLEIAPQRVFSVHEVAGEGYAALKGQGFIDSVHRDLKRTSVFLDYGGEQVRGIVREGKDGDLVWFPEDTDAAPRTKVTREHVSFVEFNKAKLVDAIGKANSLNGKPDNLSERIIFIGQRDGVGFFLGFLNSDRQAEELLSIWSKCERQSVGVVLCPTYEIGSQALKVRLQAEGIYSAVFDQILGDDLVIDLQKTGIKFKEKSGIRESKADEALRKKHGYKTNHRLTFLDRKDDRGRHVIQVDGQELGIANSNFIFLVYLAIQLKADKAGWINSDEASKAGFVDADNITHLQTMVSELRKELKSRVENPDKFIETMRGHGQYRLSMNPANIKTPGSHWLKQRFKVILPDVLKERERRVKIIGKGKN